MRAAGVSERALCLSLTDDAELRALNRQYAGEDHATDVLSFPQDVPVSGAASAANRASSRAALPRGMPALLGDVVISVPTAARQAKAAGHSLLAELFHLAVHGMVHLMGYDHRTKTEERVMFGYEAKLRAAAKT
jgi:probable rRNA maturation factor